MPRKTVTQLILVLALLRVVLMLEALYSKLVEMSGPIKTKSIPRTLTDEALHGGKLWRWRQKKKVETRGSDLMGK